MERINSQQCSTAAIVLVGSGMAALALGLRYGVLEAGMLPRDCLAADAPAVACMLKDALVQLFVDQRLGWLSLAAGAMAFLARRRQMGWIAWLAGIAGLVLYSFDPAAVGVLLGLIALLGADKQGRQGEAQPG